jgi:hypothetical protein
MRRIVADDELFCGDVLSSCLYEPPSGKRHRTRSCLDLDRPFHRHRHRFLAAQSDAERLRGPNNPCSTPEKLPVSWSASLAEGCGVVPSPFASLRTAVVHSAARASAMPAAHLSHVALGDNRSRTIGQRVGHDLFDGGRLLRSLQTTDDASAPSNRLNSVAARRDAQPPVHADGTARPTPHDRRPCTIVSVCWPFE